MSIQNSDNIFQFNINDDDTELIPLISFDETASDEVQLSNSKLSILPLRNTVLFPGVVIPITVGRDKSIKLASDANRKKTIIGVVSQLDPNVEYPEPEDLNKKGTTAKIIKMLKMPDGSTTLIIQGQSRFEINKMLQTEPYMVAEASTLLDIKTDKKDPEFSALISTIRELAMKIIQVSPNIPTDANVALKNIDSPIFLINFIASNLNIDVKEKQKLLEIDDLKERSTKILDFMHQELQMLELKNQIQSKVKNDLDQQQREYFLHQQLKTIQEELGGQTPDLEAQNLRERGAKKKWLKEVSQVFNKELDKLSRMNPAAADYSVILNHVELMVELPWNEFSNDNFDLKRATKILDKDHFGLEKIKDRILEYLAVLKLKQDMKAPILCLVGPPGVGKTSLGKSIAKALGRKYVRMSLGGVKDEATIRGHRKTYIGAMPGRIIQSIKKAGTSNPVIVLDEIDKVGSDFRGDVSSALLEVLDPEQNSAFSDHYLELDFDLTKVLFIATANSLAPIQPALLDRLEVIEITGYTIEEKVEIADRYLVPRQLSEHGLSKKDLKINKKSLEQIIEHYTRESGVRNLEKQIGNLVRGIAKRKAMDEEYDKNMDLPMLAKILGIERYDKELYQDNDYAGVVPGLAWTPVGGDILFIESTLSKGKGKLTITGNLGDVMKESAIIAMAYLKSHATRLGIDETLFDNTDVHIHVPEGATPKDGPSAGVTMLTSLFSTFTQRKVRKGYSMTGEITLRGKLLPVGGIKEKLLAAKRSGIKEIILSKANRKDVDEINKEYLSDLKFHFIDDIEEALNLAVMKEKVKKALPIESMKPTIAPKSE